jgi:hypothetical protein
LLQTLKLRIRQVWLKVGEKKTKKPSTSTTGSSLRTDALEIHSVSFRRSKLKKIIENNMSKKKPATKKKLANPETPPSLKELLLTDSAKTNNLVPPRQVRKHRPIMSFN